MMEMTQADIVDRHTILCIKARYRLNVDAELKRCGDSLDISPDGVAYNALFTLNHTMWHLEELISREEDLQKVGALYLALRELNKRRVAAKNAIATTYNEPVELKTY